MDYTCLPSTMAQSGVAQSMPQRRCSGERPDHGAHQGERAQDRRTGFRTAAARRSRRSRRRRRRSAPEPVSGSTSTAMSSPPRRSATVSAAPIRPMKVSAVAGEAAGPRGWRRRPRSTGERRRHCNHQRQAGGGPVRDGLGGERKLERRARHQDEVERAVVVVRRDQPVEREQARQQCAEPEDRRPMRASSARSGPIANGISVTTIRKNSTPTSAPPPSRRQPHVAQEDGGEGGHAQLSAIADRVLNSVRAAGGSPPPMCEAHGGGGVGGGG